MAHNKTGPDETATGQPERPTADETGTAIRNPADEADAGAGGASRSASRSDGLAHGQDTPSNDGNAADDGRNDNPTGEGRPDSGGPSDSGQGDGGARPEGNEQSGDGSPADNEPPLGLPPTEGGWDALLAYADSLPGDPLCADLSDDQVEHELRRAAGAAASAQARMLVLLGELVVRGLWSRGGDRITPAQWLSWAIGMALPTARERIRVALALRVFTKVRDRFCHGRISYSKVRAITRAGHPELEDTLLEYADNATAAQLEKVVRNLRGLTPDNEAAAHDRRGLTIRPKGDGTCEIKVVVPTDVSAHAETLLTRLVDHLDATGQPTDTQVDTMARDHLNQQHHDDNCNVCNDHGDSGHDDNHDGSSCGDDSDSRDSNAPDGDSGGVRDCIGTNGRPVDGARPAGDPSGQARLEPLSARRADALVGGLELAVAHLDQDLTGMDRTTLVLHGPAGSTIDTLAHNHTTSHGDNTDDDSDDTTDIHHDVSAETTCNDDTAPDWNSHEADDSGGDTAAGTGDMAGGRSDDTGGCGVVTDDHGSLMALSRTVLRRLACDPSLCRITTADDGTPLDVGRTTRAVQGRLRTALRARDRGCRFPGCAATRHLHAHHLVHWADGGPTDLSNLILLCGAHHRFIHTADWTITPTSPTTFEFCAPDTTDPHPNRLDPVGGGHAAAEQACHRHDSDGLIPPGYTGPQWSLDYAVGYLQEELDRLTPVKLAA